MKKNTIIVIIIAALIVAGGSFYGGMVYGKSTSTGGRGNFANLSAAQRQARAGQFGGAIFGNGQGNAGGFTTGQIISKDDKSITVSLRDGGSKLVLYSASTAVMKSASGSAGDLTAGEQVTVVGTANQDGSISAQSIQIRPEAPRVQNPATSTKQ